MPGLCSGVGLGDLSVADCLGGLLPSDGLKVATFVAYVLDLQDVQMEPKGSQVFPGILRQGRGEPQPILVYRLRGKGGQHPPEVSHKGVLGNGHDLVLGLSEDAFHRVVEDGLGFGGDLHIGDGLDVQRDIPFRESVGHRDLDGESLEGNVLNRFEDGHTHGPSTADRPITHSFATGKLPIPAREDRRHVRGHDDEEGLDGQNGHHDDNKEGESQRHRASHKIFGSHWSLLSLLRTIF